MRHLSAELVERIVLLGLRTHRLNSLPPVFLTEGFPARAKGLCGIAAVLHRTLPRAAPVHPCVDERDAPPEHGQKGQSDDREWHGVLEEFPQGTGQARTGLLGDLIGHLLQ